ARVGTAARSGARGDRGALPRADGGLLAAVGEGDARPARLPARGHPLRARSEAPPVRGPGCAPRRHDDEPPRAPRLGSHLGLSLLLAARRVLHAERLRAARALGRGGAPPRGPPEPGGRARTRTTTRAP